MSGDIVNYISSKKEKNGEIKIADPLTFFQNLVGLKTSGTNFPVFVDDSVSHGIDDIVDAFSLEHNRK